MNFKLIKGYRIGLDGDYLLSSVLRSDGLNYVLEDNLSEIVEAFVKKIKVFTKYSNKVHVIFSGVNLPCRVQEKEMLL